MNRLHPVLLLLLLGAWTHAWAQSGDTPPEETIEIESLSPGTIVFNYETGEGVATNDFVVRFRDGRLMAQRGRFNEKTGELAVEGQVVLQQSNLVWRGESLHYNFLSNSISASRFRAGRWPVFAAGEGLSLDLTNQVYTATNSIVTFDDVSNPGAVIHARHLTIAPGKYVEARDAVLHVSGVPVFYFPWYRHNLDRLANQFLVFPGYRSRDGPYLLGFYDWHMGEDLGGTVHLDYRVKRGFGGGLDVQHQSGRWGAGEFKSYYLYDLDAEDVKDFEGEDTDLDRGRFRISYVHDAEPWTNVTAKLGVRYQSDPYVVRDFFESEHHEDPQPKSFLEVGRWWPDFGLTLNVQPQINNFQETVERLPELRLTALQQPIGTLPLHYQSESRVGYLRRNYAQGDPEEDYAAIRADTFHQVLLPRTFFGWLNVTPRVGGRLSYYGRTDGAGADLDSQGRAVFNTGAEFSFKASQLWAAATNGFFQINGLRHIVEPGLDYTFVPDPSAAPSELPQFDSELPSLRLLPNQFPDYNSIDSIDSRNVLRLKLRNKLQTLRNGQLDNVINWDLYTDWRLDPKPDQDDFADLFSDLDVRPWSWLTLTSELRVDVEDGLLQIANHMVTFEPGSRWAWSVGHRYLREGWLEGYEDGNNLLLSRLYLRLNENWGLRFSHRYEIEDRRLEEQYYTVYRDFRSWTGALTFRIREDETGDTDYGVAFTFQLKAFPRYRPGDDRVRPSLLLGS